MNIFDIIGPVMIGPSSSHTAGAVRIGRIARELLGEIPVEAEIYFHGSFARTYKGHGTDRAIIAGILGMSMDDLGIRESLETAARYGICCKFGTVNLRDAHPNTVVIALKSHSGKKVALIGSSIGGGNISIRQINGLDVELSGKYDTLVITHRDAPGAVAAVTGLLADRGINIASMNVYRSRRGGMAMMIIETDQHLTSEVALMVRKLHLIEDAKAIAKV